MGRLFWKFFLSILLAQLAATVGIGGAIWLKNRSAVRSPTADLDTGPPAEMAINAAAATLQFGGPKALHGLLENMDRHRVYAIDEKGHELLGRIVSPALQIEARYLLNKEASHRVVREIDSVDGHRYLLFLPSQEHQRGLDGDRPALLPGLPGRPDDTPAMLLLRQGEWRGPGFDGGRRDGGPRAGDGPDGPGNLNRPDGPDGRRGPRARFEPLTPWAPIAAAIAASLLFAVLLAWYFSRPIRALRQAFEAAAEGDLAPRFGAAGGDKRGTELDDLGHDFDRMTARLRSLIDGQTRLLHDVSHELRSPLARLQAAIGLAHQQPEKMAASMARIERESVRMDKLVGELLTLARLESGALSALREDIPMADLLGEIADDASFEASSAGRSLTLDGQADVTVLGQADLLARAIENVVRNAIKHSPEGGVVDLKLRRLPESGQLSISVLDRGPGVAAAELEAIFQPFFRSGDSGVDGHGLGLAIAQHVVQAHGGSIVASNRPDGGLCVQILLPVRR